MLLHKRVIEMMRRNWLIIIWVFVFLAMTGETFAGASSMESLVPKESPAGWVLRDAPQTFGKETLFEHINGQADLFLQYGFERSIFAVYEKKEIKGENIDLDIYDMGDAVQAFGVFSRFRQEDHQADIGLGSSMDDGYVFFYKGRYFVMLQGAESDSAGLQQLARMVDSGITDNSPEPKELGYFPKSGLKPGSIEYYPKGLMGRQFLKRGYKATYLVPGTSDTQPGAGGEAPESTLFLAIFDNAEEAGTALNKFNEVLAKGDGAQSAIQVQPGFDTLQGEDSYQGKIILVHKGSCLAGAAGFPREPDARRLLAELTKHIE